MGILDSLKAWFRAEAAEARDLGRETKGRLETELDRREAELAATPTERLEQLQSEIADGDATFGELQSKIEGRGLRADADAEVSHLDRAARGQGHDDILDLESEEIIPPEPPPADQP